MSAPFIEQQYAKFYAEGEAAAATAAARAAAEAEEEEAGRGGGGRKGKKGGDEEDGDDPLRGVAEEVAGVVARGLQRLESEKKNRKRGNGNGNDEVGVAEAPPLPVVSSPPFPPPPPPPPSAPSHSFVPFLPASALPPLSLQHDAAPRLVEIQASLARDATAWSRGVLSTPKSLQSLLRSSLSLLDALATLQVAVSTCSSASASSVSVRTGGLTGATHLCYVRPLAPATAEVFTALRAAATAAADHLDAVSSSRTAWSGLASFFSGEMGPPRKEKEKKKKKKREEKEEEEEEGEEEEEEEEEEEDDDDDDDGGDTHHRRRHHRRQRQHHREANAATRARLRAAIEDLRERRSVSIEAQSAARRLFHVAMARADSRHHPSAKAEAAASAAGGAGGGGGNDNGTSGGEEKAGSAFVLPQYQLRHLATMSALIKAMNRFMAVLRAAAAC